MRLEAIKYKNGKGDSGRDVKGLRLVVLSGEVPQTDKLYTQLKVKL